MIIGYARVSTDGQTLDAQQSALSAAGGGAGVGREDVGCRHRPQALARAIAALGPGNTLIVTKLDRLARSTRDLLNHPRRNRQRWGNLSVVARCLGGHDNAPWAIDADGAGRPCGIRTSSDPCQDQRGAHQGQSPRGPLWSQAQANPLSTAGSFGAKGSGRAFG
jgi:hypothetical protein